MTKWLIIQGDALEVLSGMAAESVQMCVTSPPYWGLRDYGVAGQLGLEATSGAYVAKMVKVFREVRRVLRDDGTLWLNLGDSYATGGGKVGRCPDGGEQGERFLRQGHINTQPNRMPLEGLKPKDLCGIPWRVALALQADGWWLRQDIIWHKSNPMPESVTDRCTKAHEYIFLLSKSKAYYYDADAIREPQTCSDKRAGRNSQCLVDRSPSPRKGIRSSDPERFGLTRNRGVPNESCTHPAGRNRRSVWTVATQSFAEAHFATFPEKLIEPCVLAGCPEEGVVLDTFSGAGTTGVVCIKTNRQYVGIELNPEYVAMSKRRIQETIARGVQQEITIRGGIDE